MGPLRDCVLSLILNKCSRRLQLELWLYVERESRQRDTANTALSVGAQYAAPMLCRMRRRRTANQLGRALRTQGMMMMARRKSQQPNGERQVCSSSLSLTHAGDRDCSAAATVPTDSAFESTLSFCHKSTRVLLVVAGSRPGSRSRQGTPVAEAGTAQKSGRSSGGRAGSKGPSRERSAERKPVKVTLKTGGAQNGLPGMRAKSVTASGQKQQRKLQS